MIKIVKYTKKDYSSVLKMLAKLQDFEREIYPERERGKKIAKGYMSDYHPYGEAKDIIYLAKDNEKPIAFIWGFNDKEYINKHPVMYITDLFVSKKYRGQGIGKMLIDEIEKEAKRRKLKDIKLCVLKRNNNAYEAYKSLGYRDWEITMIKKVKK